VTVAPIQLAPEEAEERRRSFWRDALGRYVANRAALAATLVLALLVGACLLVPVLSPYDPYDVDFDLANQGVSAEHPLGTDQFGRDLLTRTALGGRASMTIAAAATAVVLLLGLAYGAVAGFAGARVDEAMMRLLDGLFAVPRLPAMIVILVLVGLGGGTLTLVFALSILSWMTTARLVRGQIASLKEHDFIRAAEAVGARSGEVIVRHMVPNTLGVLLVAVLLEMPAIILGEAFLSLLGLGLNAPEATWGNIAQDGFFSARPFVMVVPSAAIALFAVCVNFVADGANDALDPRRGRARGRHRGRGIDRVVRAFV
jgi:oligopeptide transport system permease protein